MNDIEVLVRRLAADLAPTGLYLELGVFDLEHCQWVTGSAPDPPRGFGNEGYVLALAGGERLLTPQDDGRFDMVSLVDNVQDWAIDQLGHGWPELLDCDGAFVGLLEPERDSNGQDVAWVTGSFHVPVGQLVTTKVALPPQWDRTES